MDGGCAVGASVVGIEVTGAGIWVGFSTAGMVFVGREAGPVGGAAVTARSHANVITINMDMNKKIFFMVAFPFIFNHTHQQ
jgi:hypothetical protein